VAARLVLAELDAAIRADIVPAAVHDRTRVQDPDLRDRGVHCDQVAMIHAEIGTERTPARVVPAVRVHPIRPVLLETRAVLVPRLHRAAAARAVVLLARPLIVPLRHRVQHLGTHALRYALLRIATTAQLIVDHGRECVAGARARLALIQYID